MNRTFVAALDANVPDEVLLNAVHRRTGAAGTLVHRGPLRLVHSGPATAAGCLLDGSIDTLGAIASRAGLDPGLAPEALLCEAYARLGTGLLDLLRGPFALLLWPPDGNELLLVRDHIGDRGLVWSRVAGGLLVAGEAADLLAAAPFTPDADEIAMAHWLAMRGMPEDRTLFAGVHRLRAGHLARLGPSARVRLERWWIKEPPKSPPADVPRGVAVERLRETLTDAISRATADAGASRTAVLLSGGLDSTAVAALAGSDVRRSYSAVFPDFPDADETDLVDLTVRHLGHENVRVVVHGGGILAASLEYVERWSHPPVSPNLFFWLPLLRRAAADGVELLLDGQGGDEVFGLSPYLLADRLRRGDLIGAIGLMGRVPGANRRPPRRDVAAWLGRYGLRGALPPGLMAARRRLRAPGAGAPEWLHPRLARAAMEVDPREQWKRRGGPRWWAHLVDATADGPGPNVAYDHIRRRDALTGLRSRHPLADPSVVEQVLALPPELAYHPVHNRPMLRAAVSGLLPDEVRLRQRKSSFDAPFHAALAGPDRAAVRRLLGSRAARTRAYADPGIVARTLLGDVPAPGIGRQIWALHTWRLVTAELWLRHVGGDSLPDDLRLTAGDLEVAARPFS